jgi:putative transposase
VTRYIDAHRERFGVEPICRTLQVAPSSYYAAKRRQPSARAVGDAVLAPKVLQVWTDNYKVYGARKVWRQLHREGVRVGRDRVARLMRGLGIAGAVRGKTRRTTIADPTAARAPDLVQRRFVATRPNQLWVSDFTYVASWSGAVYVAFVIDVHSRLIVGWRAATSMGTELVLDALEMAIWRRASVLEGLICHSDAGSQYTSIRYTERLSEIGAAPSVGTVGDSYDNSLAESTIGLYKTELIRRHGPWRTLEEVELATLAYIDWYNHRRLHGQIGNLPPAELEATYYRHLGQAAVA